MSPRGGSRPGAGAPVTTARTRGPQTVIRWSVAEHPDVVRAAGGARDVARWARPLLLAEARRQNAAADEQRIIQAVRDRPPVPVPEGMVERLIRKRKRGKT